MIDIYFNYRDWTFLGFGDYNTISELFILMILYGHIFAR